MKPSIVVNFQYSPEAFKIMQEKGGPPAVGSSDLFTINDEEVLCKVERVVYIVVLQIKEAEETDE